MEKNKNAHRPWLVRILIGMGITLSIIVVLILVLITVAVNYLKPEKLTPLVCEYANNYLNAEVVIDRLEISFYHTFPKFEIEVDDLHIKSNAFEYLPDSIRAGLPVFADSLLSIKQIKGALNIPSLMVGKISLYDILIVHPEINVVQATPHLANYDIFPASEEKGDDTRTILPEIGFGKFEIEDGLKARYVSLQDSTDMGVSLTTTQVDGKNSPNYSIALDGVANAELTACHIQDLQFGIGGDIRWSQKNPYEIRLDKFKIDIGNINTETTAKFSIDNNIVVKMLAFEAPSVKIDDVLAVIPDEKKEGISDLETDMSVNAYIQLTKPFVVGRDSIPSFKFSINVPICSAKYERMNLSRFELKSTGTIDGDNLDKSKINIERMLVIGKAVGFELNADISNIISDPTVVGSFSGGVEIQRLPRVLLSKMPLEIAGELRANSKFSFRNSYFNKDEFHRIRLTGEATLKEFSAVDSTLPANLYIRKAELKLGTDNRFTYNNFTVDSLLTASLKMDSLSLKASGVDLQGVELSMGVGCMNRASSADTSVVNPIGANIKVEKLSFISTQDSIRMRLRKAIVRANLQRYRGDVRKPQLRLGVETDRATYADKWSIALLRDASADVVVYPNIRRMSPRMKSRIDSLRGLYPTLPIDTLYRIAFNTFRRDIMTHEVPDSTKGEEVIDLELDNNMKTLVRKWRASGVLTAKNMGLFTRIFPVRNRIYDLNVRFNSDSLIISDTRYNAGNSDFLINGTISNISRALTSSSGKQRLKIKLDLKSDTIDVNEVSAAVFAGAAFLDKDSKGVVQMVPIMEDENQLQASIESVADTTSVLIIPSNIEAELIMNAENIIYSNIVFHDFSGTLNVYQGALNLNRLSAHTDVGSVDLNALYNAPNPRDVSFAFGMLVKEFHIAKFLDLVPAIDSLMPLLNDIDGIINADLAATTQIDSSMNIVIPSLKAAVKLSGDSLKVVDEKTFRTIGKWLLFKHKEKNIIDSMNVELIIDNSQLRLFPFMFDIDRYRLGVSGYNDLSMNLNYHIAVLKSPLPFKFGVNITGNVDDMKIRLGKAKFNEKEMTKTVSIADTTRVNLIREIQNVFRRGVRNSNINKLDFSRVSNEILNKDIKSDTISHSDSLYFINEGLIPAPDTVIIMSQPENVVKSKKKKK
ncbi:MAG: hypothetical protein NC453_04590 [Muribaculum sp.]|nr:hypothetical protein [Muribaculum sp.]